MALKPVAAINPQADSLIGSEAKTIPSGENQLGWTPAKSHFPTGDDYSKDFSPLVLVSPLLGCESPAEPRAFAELWNIFRWTDIEFRHHQELSAGKSILLKGGIVDFQEGEGFPIVNPHGA